MASRTALVAALALVGAQAAQTALSSYDIEYLVTGSTWASATSDATRVLGPSDSIRLKVVNGASFALSPTLTVANVRLDPARAGPATAAPATFGFTIATTPTAFSAGATAYFAVTVGGATEVGAFALSFLADAIGDGTDTNNGALAAAAAFRYGFTLSGAVCAAATGACVAPATPLAVGDAAGFLRFTWTAGLIAGNAYFAGTQQTSDFAVDPTKITVTDAGNVVYTWAQAGLAMTSTSLAASGVPSTTTVSFPIDVKAWRVGGIFSVTLADGAVSQSSGAYSSVGAANVVTSVSVSSANPLTVTYDIGTCSGACAATFATVLTTSHVQASSTLYLKVTKTVGGNFLAAPTVLPSRFVVTGAVGSPAVSATSLVVAAASTSGTGATYYFAITLTTPTVDVYTIAALAGAVYDPGVGTYYNSAAASITGLTLAWVPTFALVRSGTPGSAITQASTQFSSADVDLTLKVTYPSSLSGLATALTCDPSKFVVKDFTNATTYGTLAGVYGLSLSGSSQTLDGGFVYALIPVTFSATAAGGKFAVDALDGACYTTGGTGRKSIATANAITQLRVAAAITAQLVSIGASAAEEVIASSVVSAGAGARAIGLGEKIVLRLIKAGAPWQTAVTVTIGNIVVSSGGGVPVTITDTSCDHSAGAHYCDLDVTVLGKTATTGITITIGAAALTDGATITSAAPASTLTFETRWSPVFALVQATPTAAPTDLQATAFAPSTSGLYLAVSVGAQTTGTTAFAGAYTDWTLNWALVTVKDSSGATVSAASVGLTLPSSTAVAAAGTSALGYLYFSGIAVGATPTVDSYTLDFAQGALYTTGSTLLSARSTVAMNYASTAYPAGLTGVRVGYPLSATLVRSDKTTSLSSTWLDRRDTNVYVKLSPASGISNFGSCTGLNAITATSARFTFKFTPFGGAAATQTVTVAGAPYSCDDNSGSIFFAVDLSAASALANTGYWSLDVASSAVVSGTGGKHRNYVQTGLITAASTIMRVGYAVSYKVVDAAGNDMSTTSRHLMPGATYYFRTTRLDGGVFTTAGSPVVDPTKLSVTAAGVVTTAIAVTSAIRAGYDGSTYVEVPLTVTSAIAAGAYVFNLDHGFLTFTGVNNVNGAALAIKTGKYTAALTQAVGIHFSADAVDINGNSLEGRVLDTSDATKRVFYLRLWRTTGALTSPTLATAAASCIHTDGATSADCVSVRRLTTAGSSAATTQTVATTLYRSTPLYVDFKVTLDANAMGGAYVVDFAEGVITSATFRTGVLASATGFSIAYRLAVGTGSSDVHDGAGSSLMTTWLGPSSTAQLRIRLDTVAAPGYATGAFVGATGTVTIDTSKLVFTRASSGEVVTTFGFSGTNVFTAASAFVDVGLDLSAVAPGIYGVTLLAGAVKDVNGVTSQAQAGAVVNQASGTDGIMVGFGLTLEYWKTDGTDPTYLVQAGEWVSGSTSATYALRVQPNAAARSNNVRLSSDSDLVPTRLTAAGLFASGTAPAWAGSIGAATMLQTADTATFAWTASQGYASSGAVSTAGRDTYWYKFAPATALTIGAQAGVIAAGTLSNDDGTLMNYATTLVGSAFQVGFDLVPTFNPTDGTGAGRIGLFKPYSSTFVTSTAPIPFNAYSVIEVRVGYSDGSDGLAYAYDASPPTTAIFATFPLSSTAVTATRTTATTPNRVTRLNFALPSLLSDQRATGVYDLSIPAGTLTNVAGTVFNAELRMRVVLGMPTVVYEPTAVTPATLRSTNQSTHVYITNQRSIVVRQYIGVASALSGVAFSRLYDAVYKNGNTTAIVTTGGGSFVPGDVTNLIGYMAGTPLAGATLADGSTDLDSNSGVGLEPWYALYRLDLSGMSDGTDFYKFMRKVANGGGANWVSLLDGAGGRAEWAKPNLALIIDRTSPTASNVRFTGSVPYIGATGSVTLPTTLFADSVSAPTQIKLVGVAADDMHGFVLVPGVQGTATLVAAGAVLGPAGDVVFTLTGQDEAGNTATARLTVTLAVKPKPTLTLADNRAVFTSTVLKTGYPEVAASVLALTAIATFPEAVTGITAADLVIGEGDAGAAVVAAAPVSSANGRVWTFAVSIASTRINADNDGELWTFQVAEDAGTTVAKALSTAASSVVKAFIDSSPPTGAAEPVISPFTAVVGIPFFAPVPTTLFTDLLGGGATANPYLTQPDNIDLTSASADVSVGLAFTAGKQGAAYISGTAATKPSQGYVDFTIAARDEAGNINTGTVKYRVFVETGSTATTGYGPSGGVAAPPTLTFDTATATYRDGVTGSIALSSSASWTSVDAATATARSVDAVYVYLVTQDVDAGPTVAEKVEGTVPDVTLENQVTMSRFGANLVDVAVLRPSAAAAAAPIPAADVTSYLRSLTYTNTRSAPTSGQRTVHVVVTRGQYVVGYATKKIALTSVNVAPTISGGSLPSVGVPSAWPGNYLEADGRGVSVAPAVAVADADDSAMTKATFQVLSTDASYGVCDAARDYLYLPGDYMAPASPKVEASWDTSTCTLTLAPASGLASLAIAEFQAAMRAVKYRNLDRRDPTDGYAATGAVATLRKLQVRVSDAASGGLTSATETSAVGSFTYVRINTVDDQPTVNLTAAYAEGGLLYSADANSNWKEVVIGLVKYRTRKFAVAVDPSTSVSTTYYVPLDLRKLADRAFGGAVGLAALMDADTKAPLASGTVVTLAAASLPTGVTVAANLGGADNDGVSYYISAAGASPALSRIPITIADPSTQTGGEFKLTLTYGAGGPAVSFWVDVRVKGCILRTAGAAAIDRTRVYPDQSLCAAALAADPVLVQTITAAVGATAVTADYAALSTAVKSKADALLQAGTRLADAIAAAASERAEARGVYAVTVPAGSFSTADGSIAFAALPMDATARSLVPTPSIAGETVDKDVSIKLGPACQVFIKPVKVCVYVGDTDVSALTRNLRFASQFDCADASKGYSAMEPASEQTFNPISGELCGYTSHFSLALVVVAPVLANPTIPKVVNMGGSCPSDCSGKGYCRAEGKCVCFAGYTGYGCSQRACPVAQSLDTAGDVVHQQVECANRGVCDRATGKCACFDGYTGSGCERAVCPTGCSGHGRCLLLSELASVQAAGYASWEQDRYQVCQCDGGYSGADCSLRVCPFGDDPETTCTASRKQVQALVVSFGTLPSSLSGSLPASLYDSDELVLTYTAADGANHTTNAVKDVFDPATTGATSLRHALVSLPNFALDSVVTSGTGSSSSPTVTYKVTFDAPATAATSPRLQVANNRLPGNHAMLACASNVDGSMGCTTPGCRPLYKQARLYEFQANGGTGVALNTASLFSQPPALAGGNTAATAGQWGVEVYVAVTYDAATSKYVYAVTSDVYGTGGGASVATTPIPPGSLRTRVPLVYGLVADFDVDTSITPTTGRGAKFAWRLPTCTVTQEQAADVDYESKECGGRGVCNRGTGVCACHTGYGGYSCSQQAIIL